VTYPSDMAPFQSEKYNYFPNLVWFHQDSEEISVCGPTKVSLHPLCLSARNTILELINRTFPVTDDDEKGCFWSAYIPHLDAWIICKAFRCIDYSWGKNFPFILLLGYRDQWHGTLRVRIVSPPQSAEIGVSKFMWMKCTCPNEMTPLKWPSYAWFLISKWLEINYWSTAFHPKLKESRK